MSISFVSLLLLYDFYFHAGNRRQDRKRPLFWHSRKNINRMSSRLLIPPRLPGSHQMAYEGRTTGKVFRWETEPRYHAFRLHMFPLWEQIHFVWSFFFYSRHIITDQYGFNLGEQAVRVEPRTPSKNHRASGKDVLMLNITDLLKTAFGGSF